VAPDEIITRFILSTSHFSRLNSRVKHRAFEPSAQDNSTSVFRISALTDKGVWSLGQQYVAYPSRRTLYARADLAAHTVLAVGLHVQPDEPPPRHANIIGWPPEKHARMSIAQQLAAEASLVLNDLHAVA